MLVMTNITTLAEKSRTTVLQNESVNYITTNIFGKYLKRTCLKCKMSMCVPKEMLCPFAADDHTKWGFVVTRLEPVYLSNTTLFDGRCMY